MPLRSVAVSLAQCVHAQSPAAAPSARLLPRAALQLSVRFVSPCVTRVILH